MSLEGRAKFEEAVRRSLAELEPHVVPRARFLEGSAPAPRPPGRTQQQAPPADAAQAPASGGGAGTRAGRGAEPAGIDPGEGPVYGEADTPGHGLDAIELGVFDRIAAHLDESVDERSLALRVHRGIEGHARTKLMRRGLVKEVGRLGRLVFFSVTDPGNEFARGRGITIATFKSGALHEVLRRRAAWSALRALAGSHGVKRDLVAGVQLDASVVAQGGRKIAIQVSHTNTASYEAQRLWQVSRSGAVHAVVFIGVDEAKVRAVELGFAAIEESSGGRVEAVEEGVGGNQQDQHGGRAAQAALGGELPRQGQGVENRQVAPVWTATASDLLAGRIAWARIVRDEPSPQQEGEGGASEGSEPSEAEPAGVAGQEPGQGQGPGPGGQWCERKQERQEEQGLDRTRGSDRREQGGDQERAGGRARERVGKRAREQAGG